ncbi:MAG: LrgB family protein [Clostridium sp.]
MEALTNNLFFGIILSLVAFEIGLYINKKTRIPLFNPLLIAIIIVISFLLVFNVDFEKYNEGGKFINMFLGPATVVLAVPLYKQLELFKKNAVSILVGIFVGSFVGIVSVVGFSKLFGLDEAIIKSLISKSVTTPIGIEITKGLEGIVPITVLAIILSGIIGAVIGPTVCKVLRIRNNMAVGISIGTASHAVGTSKALELGETEGAMSSLSIGVAGLMTVFIAPIALNISISLLNWLNTL